MGLPHLIEELRALVEARPIPIDKGRVKKLARDAAQGLKKSLRFRTMDDPLFQTRGFNANRWGYHVGVYSTTDVRGQKVNVPVDVTAGEPETWMGPRYYVKGGSVTSRYSGSGKGYGSKIGMKLSINYQRTPNELLQNLKAVEKEMYSVLIHEVTHLRDLLTHSPAKAGAPSADYHNKPAEVRAFMQQIVDEVLHYAHELGQDDGGWLFTGRLTTDFIENAMEKSGTWERVRRDLTPKNEKLIIKAVTRALGDEWPKLQKLYPDDPWDEEG
jgi:hypothetical protein